MAAPDPQTQPPHFNSSDGEHEYAEANNTFKTDVPVLVQDDALNAHLKDAGWSRGLAGCLLRRALDALDIPLQPEVVSQDAVGAGTRNKHPMRNTRYASTLYPCRNR